MTSTIPPAEALLLQSLISPTERGIASRVLAKTAGGNVTLFAEARQRGAIPMRVLAVSEVTDVWAHCPHPLLFVSVDKRKDRHP